MTIGLIKAASLVIKRHGRRHRADRIARHLVPGADRARLGPRARAREVARLAPDVAADWKGSPLGRIIPGRQTACAGPEDVSVDV
jgi:hypothetical protein